MRAPSAIAEHGRQTTRAHARLDDVKSVQNQQVTQIATNTTAIGALSTGSGGTTAQNFTGKLATAAAVSPGAGSTAQADFLASLAQMASILDASTTGIGVLTAAGTGWTTTQVGYINTINTTLNALVVLVNNLLSELQSGNLMS